MNKLFSNKKNEKGQGLVEYAIILSLVAIVVVAVMGTLGKKVCNTFDKVGNSLPSSGSSSSSACGGSGMGLGFTSTFTGCSGTCTDTTFTCTPGANYTISYTASSYGGSTGSSPNHACSGGGSAFAGNFYPDQVVTITNTSTGQTQAYTVPHP